MCMEVRFSEGRIIDVRNRKVSAEDEYPHGVAEFCPVHFGNAVRLMLSNPELFDDPASRC